MEEEGKTASVYHLRDGDCLGRDGRVRVLFGFYRGQVMGHGRKTVYPIDPDYVFWRWLIAHPDYRRTITDEEVAEAKRRFELESALE